MKFLFTMMLGVTSAVACEKFLQIETYQDAADCQQTVAMITPAYAQVWGLDCCINYLEAKTAGQIWSATQAGDEIQVNVAYYRSEDCKGFAGSSNYTYSTGCNSLGQTASIISTPTIDKVYDGVPHMVNSYVTTESCENRDKTDFALQLYYKINECLPSQELEGSNFFTCSTLNNSYTLQSYSGEDCTGKGTKSSYKGQGLCKHNLHSHHGIIWECTEP